MSQGRPPRPHRHGNRWRFRIFGKTYTARPLPDGMEEPFRTEAEAWAYLAEIQRAHGMLVVGGPQLERPRSVVGAIERYDAAKPNRWDSTHLTPFENWAADMPLSAVNERTLVDFLAHMQGAKYTRTNAKGEPTQPLQPYSAEYIMKAVCSARRFLRWCANVDRYNPADSRGWLTEPPMPKWSEFEKPVPQPRAMSLEDAHVLIDSIRKNAGPGSRGADLVTFCLLTGARPSEARLLRWEQVDLKSGSAQLLEHKTRRKTRAPKMRVITLSPAVVQMLKKLPKSTSPYLFTSRSGKPYTYQGMRQLFRRRGLQTYQLRHTFCQTLVDADVSDAEAAELMGHEDTRMLRMYRTIKNEKLQRAAAAVSAAFESHAPPQSPDAKHAPRREKKRPQKSQADAPANAEPTRESTR